MKKIFAILVLIIVLFIVGCRLLAPHYEYSIWKDTHEAFGNGEYQIANVTSINGKKRILYNAKYKNTIIEYIYDYHKKNNYVYFYGKNNVEVYIILDIQSNKILYCNNSKESGLLYEKEMKKDADVEVISSYELFSEQDKECFEDLMN